MADMPWIETRDGEGYCILCQKWATAQHLGSDTHVRREADADWWMRQPGRRAPDERHAPALTAIVPWVAPNRVPAGASSAAVPIFRLATMMDMFARADPWGPLRVTYSGTSCSLVIDSDYVSLSAIPLAARSSLPSVLRAMRPAPAHT